MRMEKEWTCPQDLHQAVDVNGTALLGNLQVKEVTALDNLQGKDVIVLSLIVVGYY